MKNKMENPNNLTTSDFFGEGELRNSYINKF
jgi:hypothetical protein